MDLCWGSTRQNDTALVLGNRNLPMLNCRDAPELASQTSALHYLINRINCSSLSFGSMLCAKNSNDYDDNPKDNEPGDGFPFIKPVPKAFHQVSPYRPESCVLAKLTPISMSNIAAHSNDQSFRKLHPGLDWHSVSLYPGDSKHVINNQEPKGRFGK